MAVLRPVKLTITNYPGEKTETVTVENNPVDPAAYSQRISVTFPAASFTQPVQRMR